MLYTNEIEIKNFILLQEGLSNCAENILNLKKAYAALFFGEEEMEEDKIQELKANIDNLEKKLEENIVLFKQQIKILAQHLSVLEKKNKGFIGKIIDKSNDVEKDLGRLNQQTSPKFFNLND